METDDLQLRELAPVDPFLQPPGWPWWAWALGALVAVVVISLIAILATRKRAATPPDLGLRAEKAYREAIERINGAGRADSVQQAATSCSEAIRHYLSTVCGDPSLFETHEEFLARHKALESFPGDVRDNVSSEFSRLAALKYGISSTGDIVSLASEGRRLLDQLHQRKPA